MARIKYTALIENIRGSIGGTTFQANKYGYTIKQKPNMTRPNSQLQNSRKKLFSQAARQWRDLTEYQRGIYSTYASTFPQYTKFNDNAQLDGFGIWMKDVPLRLLFDNEFLPDFTIDLPPSITVTYKLIVAAGVFSVNMVTSDSLSNWISPFFMSRPLPVTTNFVGSKVQYIGKEISESITRDFTARYVAVYGAIPAVGDRIAISVPLTAFDYPYRLARIVQIITVTAS